MNLRRIALTMLFTAFSVNAWSEDPLATIPSLNVQRYMGTWYEVAKLPDPFQKNCVSHTIANYEALPDGTIRVTNRCTEADGKIKVAVGEVRQIGNPTSPKLEVRFAPAWLSFLPFVWGNYWVIDLDTDYQLAAVSEPKGELLWILSRTPIPNNTAFSQLVERLAKRGFDPKKMEVTRQSKS